MTELDRRRAEFRDFVWNHAADAFQAKFDTRAKLTDQETRLVLGLLSKVNLASTDRLANAISQTVAASSGMLPLLLQLVGLTRNKILQDIKGYARSTGLRISLSSPRSLFTCKEGAPLASAYLARQLIRVFAAAEMHLSPAMLETVNQATWPGYIRQERAKRMGHEAEYRIACLLRDCGVPFAPSQKAENPLCRDVKLGTVSYDLICPSLDEPLLCIKSTVHTANIGQYGESKDDLEIRAAATALKKMRSRSGVTLLAFIDGVGFESNRAGLDGVLGVAHEFCQFRTIWKVAVIAGAKIGKGVTVALPADQIVRFAEFAQRYNAQLRKAPPDDAKLRHWVAAGDGRVQPLTRG